jgi:MFS transporter, SP family, xylose:H+ symportor
MSFTAFVWWRMASGVAIGMASGLSPVYIAEIAPAESRGKLVCLNEFTIILRILAAQTVNWLIVKPVPLGTSLVDIQTSWKGQERGGGCSRRQSCRRRSFWSASTLSQRACAGEKHALKTVGEMRTSFHAEANLSVGGALRNPRWLPVLGIGITLAVLQQWCGINVIFNYAQEVFSAAGYDRSAMSAVWPYPCCSNAITRW